MSDQPEYQPHLQDVIDAIVGVTIDELKWAGVWPKLSESQQDVTLERLYSRAKVIIAEGATTLAELTGPTIPGLLQQVTVKDSVKAVIELPRTDPGRHDLMDATGSRVHIVVTALGTIEELGTTIKPDPDQSGLPLDEDSDAA